MRHIKRFWARDGDMTVWAVECVSGLALILYAMLSLYVRDSTGAILASHIGFSKLVSPEVWQPLIGMIGILQVTCSVHRNPLCSIVTAYPAMIAFSYAAVAGGVYSGHIEPMEIFAGAWGVLNYVIIRHNGAKAKGEIGG